MWNIDSKGSVTYADGMLYLRDERATMKLVWETSEKYEKKGEFKVPLGGLDMYRAHPFICGGKLFIRHSDKHCSYDIKVK